MPAIFFGNDLMFSSRVELTARAAGEEFGNVANLDGLSAKLTSHVSGETMVIIVDLETPGLDVNALASVVAESAPEARLIGYAGHMRTQLLAGAREAGFTAALSRGQFNEQLPQLFTQDA